MSKIRNSLRNHWVIMAVCCLIPLAALVAIMRFNAPVTIVALVGLALICPLSHFVLMRDIMNHDQHEQ